MEPKGVYVRERESVCVCVHLCVCIHLCGFFWGGEANPFFRLHSHL